MSVSKRIDVRLLAVGLLVSLAVSATHSAEPKNRQASPAGGKKGTVKAKEKPSSDLRVTPRLKPRPGRYYFWADVRSLGNNVRTRTPGYAADKIEVLAKILARRTAPVGPEHEFRAVININGVEKTYDDPAAAARDCRAFAKALVEARAKRQDPSQISIFGKDTGADLAKKPDDSEASETAAGDDKPAKGGKVGGGGFGGGFGFGVAGPGGFKGQVPPGVNAKVFTRLMQRIHNDIMAYAGSQFRQGRQPDPRVAQQIAERHVQAAIRRGELPAGFQMGGFGAGGGFGGGFGGGAGKRP